MTLETISLFGVGLLSADDEKRDTIVTNSYTQIYGFNRCNSITFYGKMLYIANVVLSATTTKSLQTRNSIWRRARVALRSSLCACVRNNELIICASFGKPPIRTAKKKKRIETKRNHEWKLHACNSKWLQPFRASSRFFFACIAPYSDMENINDAVYKAKNTV